MTALQPSAPSPGKIHSTRGLCLAVLALLTISELQPLPARLISLNAYPWAGYFAGYSTRDFRIGLLSSTGEIRLVVLADGDKPLPAKLDIPIQLTVEQTLPNGNIVRKRIDPATLQSAQKATDKLDEIVVRGETEDKQAFEFTIEQQRGTILIGGRLLPAGGKDGTSRVAWQVDFAAPYPYSRAKFDEAASKNFHTKLVNDRITLNFPDNKTTVVDFMNGKADKDPISDSKLTGIAEAKINICSYGDKTFTFTASRNSNITLMTNPRQSLPGGFALLDRFSLVWRPDPAKDADGSARLAIAVK